MTHGGAAALRQAGHRDFATLLVTGGIGWSIHLVLGSIVLAGLVGVALAALGRLVAAEPLSG